MERVPYEFLTIQGEEGLVAFPYEEEYIEEFLDFMHSTKAKKLFFIGFPAHTEQIVLSHLVDMKIEEIYMWGGKWSAIRHFKHLKRLVLKESETIYDIIDFDWFPNLETYIGPFGSKLLNTEKSNVKTMYLSKDTNTKVTDFQVYKMPGSVEFLTLNNLTLKSLEGISPALKELGCYQLKQLKDISALANAKDLSKFEAWQFNITSEMYPYLPNLKFLHLAYSVVDNLDFLEKLPNLTNFLLDSKVLNNDLSILKQRKWEVIYFKDRKEYNVKLKDLEKK